jgi:hypothetical protein
MRGGIYTDESPGRQALRRELNIHQTYASKFASLLSRKRSSRGMSPDISPIKYRRRYSMEPSSRREFAMEIAKRLF